MRIDDAGLPAKVRDYQKAIAEGLGGTRYLIDEFVGCDEGARTVTGRRGHCRSKGSIAAPKQDPKSAIDQSRQVGHAIAVEIGDDKCLPDASRDINRGLKCTVSVP